MPKISVIVPVYNVEKYLRFCVESLLSQTYKNIEIILVDDKSCDGSGAICDELASADSRIKVIHKEKNEGLGKARESGFAVASGEWICYVDSDDWIEHNTFERLMLFVPESCEIMVFGLIMQHQDAEGKTRQTEKIIPESKVVETKEQIGTLVAALDTQRCFPYMCNKLYKAEFVKNSGVKFNSIKSMEDFFYNIEIFKFANCVAVIPEAFYNYRKPASETLASAYNKDFFILSKKRYEAERLFLKNSNAETEDNLQSLYAIYFNHLIVCLMRDAQPNARLKGKERLGNVKGYLDDSVTVDVLKKYKPDSLKRRLLAKVLYKKKYRLAVLIGKSASIVSNSFGMIFRAIKKH